MDSELRKKSNCSARPSQRKLWDYLVESDKPGKRAIEVAHRRWGKDEVCLHATAVLAMRRPGTYWHCLPLLSQSRRAIWAAVNPHTGKRRIDEAFPHAIRASTNEQEMFIRFVNGSTWTVIGSDSYDSLVGSSVAGIVFSEWSRAVPTAWPFLAPILVENGGWACFISTPLGGSNHMKSMFDMAVADPNNWFAEISTVADTGAISLDAIEQQRREYVALFGEAAGNALIEQEFYCSWSAVVPGAYYTREIIAAEREKRITQVDVDPDLPVHSAWDLGMDDSTAIFCFQINGGELRIVDFYEASGHGAEHYASWLNEQGYRGVDWVPHDARVREWGSGRSRLETLRLLGRKPRIVPAHSLMDGINAALLTIPIASFDAARCARGIECLRSYQAEWDENLRTYKQTPKHDFASHAADAWRYLSMSWREPIAPDEEVDPIKELLKPRTWSDVFDLYRQEQIDAGLAEEGELLDFNPRDTVR